MMQYLFYHFQGSYYAKYSCATDLAIKSATRKQNSVNPCFSKNLAHNQHIINKCDLAVRQQPHFLAIRADLLAL